MCIFDHETLRCLAVNDAALRLYGYTRDEFLGITLRETRPHTEESEQAARLSTSLLPRHGGMRNHLKRSGEIFLADVVSQDIIFDGRKASLVLVLETTERVRSQRQRMEREQLFTTLVEHSPDIIARIDRDLRHVYVNPAVATATGVSPEQIVGNTNRQLGVPLELCVRWAAGVRRVFSTGRQQEIEISFPGSDGMRHYESHMVPEFDAEGRVESVLAIARDITPRKRAELALRASESKLKRAHHEFEALADGLPQVIACYDRELRYTYANAAIDRLTQLPRAELIGRTVAEMGLPGPLADSWNRSLRSVFDTGRPSKLDFEHAASGGARQYEAHHIPLTGDDGGVETVLCVASDITERKRAEDERLSAMARQSDALLREVHHRVKNNLQGVVGLLRQLANLHEPLAPVLAKAVSQLQAMAVVHGLHGRDWRDGVALRGMVTEIAKSVERTTGVQVKCNGGAEDDAHLRENEAVAVALVVNELILNAAKHGSTSPKGTVTVDVTSDAQRAEVAVLNKGSLPAHFDFNHGDGLGTGLELVKALVPTDGARLAFSRNNGQVRATLALVSPVMVHAPDAAKEMRDEWDRRRRAYSDRRR